MRIYEKSVSFDVFIHRKGAKNAKIQLFFAVLPVHRYFWWINGKE